MTSVPAVQTVQMRQYVEHVTLKKEDVAGEMMRVLTSSGPTAWHLPIHGTTNQLMIIPLATRQVLA